MTSSPRKSLAEVHGNRTHLPPYSEGTPDLKSGGPTSEPRTSSGNRRRASMPFRSSRKGCPGEVQRPRIRAGLTI